ncbi:hypothetical protein KFU94_43005 [Chloroflexi bacterium TSY]|nr:hypothetical protein [Chloroflexi bacterium TSY]
MSRLTLQLFGFPHLERDGEPIHIGRRKALAILIYIAVTASKGDVKVGRDRLAALFWPEYDQNRARTDLRWMLSLLNKALGKGILVADRETVGLNPQADLWLDTAEFRQIIQKSHQHEHSVSDACPHCLSLLAEAVELYRDDFLAGFTLRDSPDFDDWQYLEGQALRQECSSILDRLAQGYMDDESLQPAIDVAQRWLTLDPISEPAHRHLMKLYALTDQGTASLRQYELCLQALEEELGVPPEQVTQDLYWEIRENRISLSPSAKPQTQPIAPLQENNPADQEAGRKKATPKPIAEVNTNLVSKTSREVVNMDNVLSQSDIRTVTVLCAGLAQFQQEEEGRDDETVNEMSEAIDGGPDRSPQDTTRRVKDFHQMAQAVLRQYDARVDRLLDQGILAVFDAGSTDEEDAQKAIEAAFDIQQAAQAAGFEVNAGINSGVVYCGQQDNQSTAEVSVSGPVVNLALRLRGQSHAGQILVGDNTQRRTRDRFAYEPLNSQVRGIIGRSSELSAYLVTRSASSSSKNRQSPFVRFSRSMFDMIPQSIRRRSLTLTRTEATFWIFLAIVLTVLGTSLILQLLNAQALTQIFIGMSIFAIGVVTLDFIGVLGDSESSGVESGELDQPDVLNDTASKFPEIDTADVDASDVSASDRLPRSAKPILSVLMYIRTFVYFCLGFGPAGLAAMMAGRGAVNSLLIGIPVGIVTIFLARIFFNFQHSNIDSSLKREDLLFQRATVTIPLTHTTMGKVRVQVGPSVSELYALAVHELAGFNKGDVVRIVRVTDEHVYVE